MCSYIVINHLIVFKKTKQNSVFLVEALPRYVICSFKTSHN